MNRLFQGAPVALALLLLLAFLLAGCAAEPPESRNKSDSRYTMDQDTGPAGAYDISNLQDAVPTAEPYSRGGNRSTYTVWGKSYNVMASNEGYEATGIASWYGAKFHGHKTSNGETYDMYKMSAAHRSLPLPSFVQVTNLANNRQVIVRVNDRGPFHSDRIIDLSYAAAKKLGYKDQGTARVSIAAITVKADGSWSAAGSPLLAKAAEAEGGASDAGGAPEIVGDSARPYVQVGAFRSATAASSFQQQVKGITDALVTVTGGGDGSGWHRVQVGPFGDRSQAETERNKIQAQRIGQPIIVMRDNTM